MSRCHNFDCLFGIFTHKSIRVDVLVLEEQLDDVCPPQLHSLGQGDVAGDVSGPLQDDEYYCLDTFMLGLTPSWSRASSTLVALPCFTAVLTIRIGGLMFGRLQTPELCSPEFRAGFRVLLHFAVQVTNQDGSLL